MLNFLKLTEDIVKVDVLTTTGLKIVSSLDGFVVFFEDSHVEKSRYLDGNHLVLELRHHLSTLSE